MSINRSACVMIATAWLFCIPQSVPAQHAVNAPAQKTIGGSKTEMVPSLAVLNSKGTVLQGNKLTLTDVSLSSIVFADRPVRAAGHVLTSEFIKQWDVGNNSFARLSLGASKYQPNRPIFHRS
jgi:hypothetical protein